MSKSLRQYENDIAVIVDQTLKEIFKQYFQMDIDPEKFHFDRDLQDAMTSRSKLSDKDALTIIMLSIEKDMMDYIVARVFPSGGLGRDMAAQSCINEINNIVSSRVKTFFNERGFDFQMEIPEVLGGREPYDDGLAMLFSSHDNLLAVDIDIERPHSGYRVSAQ